MSPVIWSVVAAAGDPCPIGLDFHVVTPRWRDGATDLAGLNTQRRLVGVRHADAAGGVVLKAVVADSPAGASGLAVGDRVVHIDDRPVTDSASLNRALDAAGPTVRFGVDRAGAVLELAVQTRLADPLVLGLMNRAEADACRAVQLKPVTPEQVSSAHVAGFDEQRGFRCEDAHTRMKGFQSGDVVITRGGERVMLTMPGWRTVCVSAAELDGPGLTPKALDALLAELTGPYVRDRHENP